jgi:hypothetical protein
MVHLGHCDLLEVSVVVVTIILNLKVFVSVIDIFYLNSVESMVDILRILCLFNEFLTDSLKNGRHNVLDSFS